MSSSARASNRRVFSRRDGKGEISCRLDKHGMGKEELGTLIDVSQTGAMFIFDKELDKGMEIVIELRGTGVSKGVRTPARIQRCEATDDEWLISCEFDRRIPYDVLVHLVR